VRNNLKHFNNLSGEKNNLVTVKHMKFQFERKQISKVSRHTIIDELEKVAKHYNYSDFRQADFNKLSNISHDTVCRELGSWKNIMEFLKEFLKQKGIEFTIGSRRSEFTKQEMFDEIERIWTELGHRPSRNEWVANEPNISYDTIYRHFSSWTNACLKFIEYKSGDTFQIKDDLNKTFSKDNQAPIAKTRSKSKIVNSRTISLSVRMKVMNRDKFRCIFCGKSPATDLGTKLHIDHIIPFSKGGSNQFENLQTLCDECNFGKSSQNINR